MARFFRSLVPRLVFFSLTLSISQITFNLNTFAREVISLESVTESVEPICGPKVGRTETICVNARYCVRERAFGGYDVYRPDEGEECRHTFIETTIADSTEAERLALGVARQLYHSGLIRCSGPDCEPVHPPRIEAIPVTCGGSNGYYGFITLFCRKRLPPDDIAAVPSDILIAG